MPGRLAAVLAVVAALAVVTAAVSAGKPPPPKDTWPPGVVDITTVSNGCGPTSAVTYKNRQTYARADGETITVSFRDACNLHDAAYSGAYVWDPISGAFVDFSDPKWTKATINEKFKRDLERSCSLAIPLQPIWVPAIEKCLTEDNTSPVMTWGAPSYYDMVTDVLNPIAPRPRIQLDGSWRNQNPGFPVCDIGANPWTMSQSGRKVTARWEHGTSGGAVGRFTGTFVTGDALGDDRVVGTYEIVDGGKAIGKGEMTFVVHSDERFDFSSTGIAGSGTMLLRQRATQAVAAKCSAPKTKPKTKPTPAVPAGTFTLAATTVTNTNQRELKIDATGGTAHLDHCCDGGKWVVDYTWKVPRTLTADKTASISLSIKVLSVEPSQPLGVQMSALAPGFREDLPAHYPDMPSASKTYTTPKLSIHPQSKEVFVYVGWENAEIRYTYRRTGA